MAVGKSHFALLLSKSSLAFISVCWVRTQASKGESQHREVSFPGAQYFPCCGSSFISLSSLPHVFSLITLENPFYCCEFLLYYLVYRDFSFLLSELATQLTRISHIWIREDGLLALVQPNIFHLKSIQLCFKLPKEKKNMEKATSIKQ